MAENATNGNNMGSSGGEISVNLPSKEENTSGTGLNVNSNITNINQQVKIEKGHDGNTATSSTVNYPNTTIATTPNIANISLKNNKNPTDGPSPVQTHYIRKFQISAVTMDTLNSSNPTYNHHVDPIKDTAENSSGSTSTIKSSSTAHEFKINDIVVKNSIGTEEIFTRDDVFFHPAPVSSVSPVIPTRMVDKDGAQYGLAVLDESGNAHCGVESLLDENDAMLEDKNSEGVHVQNRFKVVKIMSTEPFKKGRWVCMDYCDQATSATTTNVNPLNATTIATQSSQQQQLQQQGQVQELESQPLKLQIQPASNMAQVQMQHQMQLPSPSQIINQPQFPQQHAMSMPSNSSQQIIYQQSQQQQLPQMIPSPVILQSNQQPLLTQQQCGMSLPGTTAQQQIFKPPQQPQQQQQPQTLPSPQNVMSLLTNAGQQVLTAPQQPQQQQQLVSPHSPMIQTQINPLKHELQQSHIIPLLIQNAQMDGMMPTQGVSQPSIMPQMSQCRLPQTHIPPQAMTLPQHSFQTAQFHNAVGVQNPMVYS